MVLQDNVLRERRFREPKMTLKAIELDQQTWNKRTLHAKQLAADIQSKGYNAKDDLHLVRQDR